MRLKRASGYLAVEVNACARGSQWSKALELLGSMERSGVGANILTYNAAISACTKVQPAAVKT